MITVNGWCASGMGEGVGVGRWGDECSVNGGDGESLRPKRFPTFFEKIDRRTCKDGSRELIPVFL